MHVIVVSRNAFVYENAQPHVDFDSDDQRAINENPGNDFEVEFEEDDLPNLQAQSPGTYKAKVVSGKAISKMDQGTYYIPR